ncbi:hypothetical protein JZ751_004451 [Albula glossodonta]|uniref:FERM, ARHGEF and pleckstrin domain-containing protein 1 n=1 Tax=Albula glossodonta TaxID=121402 RepID=A0A8T2NCQ9_9TELE|nr:hypothetical protein JZ751_004451 [Albula glossodonta]
MQVLEGSSEIPAVQSSCSLPRVLLMLAACTLLPDNVNMVLSQTLLEPGAATLLQGSEVTGLLKPDEERLEERGAQLGGSQRASGRVLLDLVCTHLNLIEGDYFGLEYQDHRKMTVWLDLLKPIMKQIRRPKHTVLRFVVKFFPPDHTQLLEELTRYLFALQVKQDLATGILTCNDSSAALLVSHIRSDAGGVRLPAAGGCPSAGDGHTRINAFNWSKVRKLSFKRKRFLIKLRPDLNQSAYQDTLEFLMASRDCCKVFWKICVEYHAFFRLFEEPKPKPKPVLFTRGSSFRFSGRTQKQVIDYVKDSEFKKIPFERKHSKVQSHSGLSPLPSLQRPQVPKESVLSSSGDELDSPTRSGWRETVTVSIEDSSASRKRSSPSPQHNGREDRERAGPRTDPSPSASQRAEHLSAGVAVSSPRLLESSGHPQGAVNGQRHGLAPGQSPDGRQPSPLTSPLLNDAGCVRTDDEDEPRRAGLHTVPHTAPNLKYPACGSAPGPPLAPRFPTDKAYFIAKELLTTERTYLKDLEVITVSFQNSVGKDEATPESLRNSIFSNFDPLHKFHSSFLREVEQRLALWEGRSNAHIKGDYQRVGDVMLKNVQGIKKHSEALLELEKACRSSRRLEALCRDFELQKVCYLPLNVFLLRPLHRLMHYKQILERLCKHYPPTHQDFRDSRAALADVSEMVAQLHCPMIKMENFQKLLELKKDLIGIDNLAIPGRFNDVLMYTSRGMTAANQFKVHGQLPLYGMTRSSVVVAASSVSEMEKWMEDIKMAIDLAEKCNGPSSEPLPAGSPLVTKSSEDPTQEQESEDDLSASRTSLQRQEAHRGNTTVHVCWHRNTSVSMVDFSIAVENQLSGNLLRKFKNSNGWQKLWVVFTNFSLFFYKTHQDDYPLASLPLLGYSVTIPSESENIHKDYVFKLHFKSHVDGGHS